MGWAVRLVKIRADRGGMQKAWHVHSPGSGSASWSR
jgi:hypothetical protein